jgi:hypothetical protein
MFKITIGSGEVVEDIVELKMASGRVELGELRVMTLIP